MYQQTPERPFRARCWDWWRSPLSQDEPDRPVVAFKSADHQIVAVGNRVYFSNKWKTFPDFLAAYMKQKLGAEWGNAEIAKPLAERHPLMQWYDAYCKYQQATIKTSGEVCDADVIGIVACYLGLGYSLYLLDHNVEIQERLLGRLRDPANFQDAFYELFVANVLIRAGFQLTLEYEGDGTSKHCEFAALSRETGKRYFAVRPPAKTGALPQLSDFIGASYGTRRRGIRLQIAAEMTSAGHRSCRARHPPPSPARSSPSAASVHEM